MNACGILIITYRTGCLEPIDLSAVRMKCIGAQWLVHLHEYLCDSPYIILSGFHAQSLSSGFPHLSEPADEDHSILMVIPQMRIILLLMTITLLMTTESLNCSSIYYTVCLTQLQLLNIINSY